MSPDQINDLRRRVLAKESVSDEELAEAIKALRNGRQSAATAAAAKKAKSTVHQVDLNDTLAKFGL